MIRIIGVIALSSIVICLSLVHEAEASGLCCQLSSGVQESLAGVAAPGTEEVSLQFNYSFTRMDKIKEGSADRSLDEARLFKKADGTSYTSLPLSMDMMKYTLTAGYGFTPNFKAFVSVPYVRNTMDMTSSNGAMLGWTDMTMPPVAGLGDTTVMGLVPCLHGQGNKTQQCSHRRLRDQNADRFIHGKDRERQAHPCSHAAGHRFMGPPFLGYRHEDDGVLSGPGGRDLSACHQEQGRL